MVMLADAHDYQQQEIDANHVRRPRPYQQQLISTTPAFSLQSFVNINSVNTPSINIFVTMTSFPPASGNHSSNYNRNAIQQ